MLKMLRIVEMAWLVVSAICVIEFIRLFNTSSALKWYFLIGVPFGIFMFWFRRRSRLRYEQKVKEKQEE